MTIDHLQLQRLAHPRVAPPIVGHPDVIFTFSFETWADAVERECGRPPDRFVEWLDTEPSVGRVVVADPFRSWPVRFAKRLVRRPQRPSRPPARAVLLSPMRAAHRERRTPSGLHRSYARYDAILESAAASAGMRAPHVITVHPLIAGFCPFSWAKSVTYWALDDWAVHPDYAHAHAAIHLAYERMRERSVPVASVSQVLVDRIGSARSTVLPNAVDAAEFGQPSHAPKWFVDAPRPRLVYQGSIDGRLDIGALESISDALREATLYLVGPLMDRQHLGSLPERPNVVLTGNLSRTDLLGVLFAADAGIVAHADTPLTRAMSPLKLYEYLAAGCPVVATDLAPMRSVSHRVRLVGTPDAWAASTRAALAEGRASETERVEFVRANHWGSRFETLLGLATSPTAGAQVQG